MFSALAREKAFFRPFVFKMFSALGVCALDGYKVAMQSVALRLGRCGIIKSFLLRVRDDAAQDQARSSRPARTDHSQSLPGLNERACSMSHSDSPRAGRADLRAHAVA
jgi:hypothetical protein